MIWSTVDLTALVVAIAIPIVVVAAFGVINLLEQIGGNHSSFVGKSTAGQAGGIEAPELDRREEIRQMLEAASNRRKERGQAPIDVDMETERLLGADSSPVNEQQQEPQADSELREEIRQLVETTNERRKRRGLEPLDVDHEIDRRLRELT